MRASRSLCFEGERARHRGPVMRLLVALLTLGIAAGPLAPAAFANPEGGNVVEGEIVQWQEAPGDLFIQTGTDSTIIDWNSFDIGQGERVEFLQPGEWSRTLNRALGVNASVVDGTLISNGQVYIANEAGVYFGGNAIVNVAELVAAGGNLSNEDFMAGVDHFTDLSGGVLNQGQIHAGSVTLAGEWVSNQGTVIVDDGALLMLAGDEIWVTKIGTPILIKLQTSGTAPAGPAVENTGTLDAGRGSVRMAAGDPLGISIRNTGDIIARKITLEGEDLVQVSGTLDASTDVTGEVGGEIQVLGERVLVDDALLDASGPGGGGSILVGGDFQGGGDVRSAEFTRLGANASLVADAVEDGDGGKVIVWADNTADVQGHISARGGAQGGDGGFAETSGKRMLYVDQAPDLRAPEGTGGLWLIDPSDVSIVAQATNAGGEQVLDPAFSDPIFEASNPGIVQSSESVAQVTASLIAESLAEGQSITVTTQTLIGDGGQKGNIVVEAPIIVEDSDTVQLGNLILTAANDITLMPRDPSQTGDLALGGAILNRNPDLALNIGLFANDPNQPQNSTEDASIGTVTLGADIETGGGALSISAADVITEQRISTGGGPLGISSFGGDITIGNQTASTPAPTDVVIDTAGGLVELSGSAAQNPDAPDGVTDLIGGNITIESNASIVTDGGDISIVAQGADVTLEDRIPTQTTPVIDTNGGLVQIDARNEFLFGGNLLIGRKIDSSVKIDDGMGGLMNDPDSVGGSQVYQTEADVTFVLNDELVTGGGSVLLGNRFQDGDHRINANITTRGGSFVAEGGKQLVIADDVVIDTLDDPANAVNGVIPAGDVRAIYRGDILVQDRVVITGDLVSLQAGRAVEDGSGADGIGDLIFSPGRGGPGQPTTTQIINADEVLLNAGNGYTPIGERPVDGSEDEALADQRTAQIEFGGLELRSRDDVALAPTTISILQDANLDASVLDGILPPAPAPGPDISYTLQSADGVLTLDTASTINTLNATASDLTLIAKNDFDFDNTVPPPAIDVDVVTLRTAEGFVIDQSVADVLAQVESITIEAGQNARAQSFGGDANNATVIDEVSGDLILDTGVSLTSAPGNGTTDSQVVLHGGIAGLGDLILKSSSSVNADSITLQAGDGFGTGNEFPAVNATSAGRDRPNFRRQDGTARPDSFTLHQDAEIADANIPLRTQLSDDGNFLDASLVPMNYTLQSDQGNVTIGVPGDAGPTKVDDSNLVVLAGGTVLLDQAIRVPSADIGGRGNFQVTQGLLDNIVLEHPDPSANERLVLRAGAAGSGTLDFESGVTVEANELRLVAGDGTGGAIAAAAILVQQPTDPTYVAPQFRNTDGSDAPDVFVFRQDAAVDDAQLATLPELDQFGATNDTPRIYGVRSDDDFIAIQSPQDVVGGSEELILSADRIEVTSTDADLVFNTSVSQADPMMVVALRTELRGDTIDLRATGDIPPADPSDPSTPARVDGSSLDTLDPARPTITSFEADDLDALPSFDLDVIPNSAPQRLRITSEGTIGDDAMGRYGLPSLDSFPIGDDPMTPRLTGMAYDLTSNAGDVNIDVANEVEGTDLSVALAAEGTTFNPAAPLNLSSLTATHELGLEIQNDTVVIAVDQIVLAAGTSGEGDLSFGTGVDLTANQIQLVAGDGEDVSTDDDGEELPPARIDALGNDPQFRFSGDDAAFLFLSDADIRQTDDGVASVLPDGSQLQLADPSAVLERYLIQSDQGSAIPEYPLGLIDITNFSFGAFGSPTILEFDGAVVRLGALGDLDFRDSATALNETVNVRALVIDLASTNGQVHAAGDRLQMSGALGELSPRFFSLTQNDTITAANLPDIDQFEGGFVFVGVDIESNIQLIRVLRYALHSTDGDIVADDLFRAKVSRDIERAFLFVKTDDDQNTIISTDLELTALTAESPVQFGATGATDDISVETIGGQLYSRPISLEAPNTTLTGATVGIVAPPNATGPSVVANGAGKNLTLIASQQVVVGGDIGSDTNRIGSFEARMTQPTATVEFGGIVAVDASLTPPTDEQIESLLYTPISVYTEGDITLDSVIESDDGSTTTARTAVPTTATIFKRFGDLTLDSSDGNVVVSQNEKISVGGQLDIAACTSGCAPGSGVVRIGDISAFGVSIMADSLDLLLRAPGSVADVNGNLSKDTGLDLLANDFAFQINQVTFNGAGAQPVIGTVNPESIPVTLVSLPVAAARPQSRPINEGDFAAEAPPAETTPSLIDGTSFTLDSALYSRGGVEVLDLRPTGASRAEITEVYTEPIPLPRDPAPSEWLPDTSQLGAVGVAVREPTADELESWAKGAAIYDDVSGGSNIMGPIVLVASPRLVAGEADDALASYRKVFGPYNHRAPQLKRILGRVVDDYLRETGARRVVGFELRRYIRNRPNSQQEAFRALEDLATLARHHRNLGLAPAEYRQIQRIWLSEITPEGITAEELGEAIYPSRYVRGSDILDLFGR